MASSMQPNERQPPRKATLFCTECNHASHINGEWIIQIHEDCLEYECPNCGKTIDSRRAEAALTTQSGGTLQLGNAD